MKEKLEIKGNVVVVLENAHTGKKRVFKAKNLVTDAGDLHYAEHGAHASPTNVFGIFELATGHTAVPAKGQNRSNITGYVTGSQKAMTATYPKVNDVDSDNTGAGVDIVTYLVSYLTSEANNGAITEVIITNVTPGASEPILTHADLTSFAKTSSDTLKVFVNHTLTGI